VARDAGGIPAGSTVAGRKLPAADRLGILSVWMEAVPVETVPVEAGDLGPEAPPGISPDKLGTCSVAVTGFGVEGEAAEGELFGLAAKSTGWSAGIAEAPEEAP